MRPLNLWVSSRNRWLPVAAILSAVVFWGGSFTATRVAVQVLDPWTVMAVRMSIALGILLPFVRRLKPTCYRAGDWKLLTAMVLFQPCLYFLLEANALRLTTSSQAGVISASVPLLVAVGAWMILSESITVHTILGLILSIGGVGTLTALQQTGGIAADPLLGNSLELAAMACAAANMVVVKRLCRRYDPWSLTALQVAAGALFFLPGLRFLPLQDSGVWTPELVLSLAFLGSFVSVGGFGLYNWGMSRISATRAAAFINLVPVTAVLFGWVLLGEALSTAQCLAGLLVIGGVSLNQRVKRVPATG